MCIGADNEEDKSVSIREIFIINSIAYRYTELKTDYLQHPIKSRNKNVPLNKEPLTIGQRSFEYFAKKKKNYNVLPKDLKKQWVTKKIM